MIDTQQILHENALLKEQILLKDEQLHLKEEQISLKNAPLTDLSRLLVGYPADRLVASTP